MVANVDGYVATEDPGNLLCGCKKTGAQFDDTWKVKVVADTVSKRPEHVRADEALENTALSQMTGRML